MPEVEIQKKSPKKFKVIFLIFIIILGGFIFYQLAQSFFPGLIRGESLSLRTIVKDKGGILDMFSPKGLGVGDLAPDFVAEDISGNKTALSDFKNKKPVLLVFWATWCGYCAKELPNLKGFAQDHQKEIQVIAVSSGESKETIKKYIQEKDINFLMLLDENRKIWNQYLVRGTPSHFLIDSSGKIAGIRPGLASREDLEIMMTMLTELW